MLHAVIMAGGSGTRFWPESRESRPKQLLNLVGDQSMIQSTVSRLGTLVTAEQILVVTNRRLVEPIAEQLPDLPRASIIGEPCKRDTAPCVGLAAALVAARDPEATMVVMPADHVISTDAMFQASLQHAVDLVEAEPNRIVTFGIRPTYPAEIYGYIERDASGCLVADTPATYRVSRFREKPDLKTASEFVAAGSFYWNSGIFVWKARTIWQALEKYEPEMHAHLKRIADGVGTDSFHSTLQCEFEAIVGKSIDYAVMERFEGEILVVDAPFQWDDVGNWPAMARLHEADENGNTIIGRHLGVETKHSIIRTSDDHLIVTVGLDDTIVVHTPDATLVARRDQEAAIRKIVSELGERGWTEYL
jgi:mannose-1-phosphate guanylyltransferase